MATPIERERKKEKELHDKLDKILEAIENRNLEEARKQAKTLKGKGKNESKKG